MESAQATEKGFTGHFPKVMPPKFTKPDGLDTITDDQNRYSGKLTFKLSLTGEM
jgi:hypothetical protein